MTEIAFFDTNIFLYASDPRDPTKRAIAIETLASTEARFISTQVVQEFYAAATKKLGIPPADAAAEAEALCDFPLIVVNRGEILRAIRITQRYGFSFWDALIIAAAETAKAAVVYSEDLSHGQNIGGIRIVNPFLHRLQ